MDTASVHDKRLGNIAGNRAAQAPYFRTDSISEPATEFAEAKWIAGR